MEQKVEQKTKEELEKEMPVEGEESMNFRVSLIKVHSENKETEIRVKANTEIEGTSGDIVSSLKGIMEANDDIRDLLTMAVDLYKEEHPDYKSNVELTREDKENTDTVSK